MMRLLVHQHNRRAKLALGLAVSSLVGMSVGAPAFCAETSVTAPVALLEVTRQVLLGPNNKMLEIAYAAANSAYRSANGALEPTVSADFLATEAAPFSDTKVIGALLGPSLKLTVPTGEGSTVLQLGVMGSVATDANKLQKTVLAPSASLSLELPLLAGADLRSSAADHALSAARSTYQRSRSQLMVDAVSAYYALQNAAVQEWLAQQTSALAVAEYNRALDQSAQGTISHLELNRLRSNLQSATDDELTATQALGVCRDRLQALLGVVATSPLLQVSTSTAVTATTEWHANTAQLPTDLAGWLALAAQQRPDLEVAIAAVQQAEQAANKVAATASKSIALTAAATWPRTLTETKQDLRTEVQIGLRGTIYLHNTTRTETVTAADLKLSLAQQQLQAKHLAVEQEVKQAFYDLEAIRRALIQANELYEQENLLLSTTKQRLQQGLAIQLDVQAQELAVAQQEARVERLQGDVILRQLMLWHATGLQVTELSI